MGIEGANLKNESLFQTFVALRNERLQMVMCDVECYGLLLPCYWFGGILVILLNVAKVSA